MQRKGLQFQFLELAMSMRLPILSLICLFREENFKLYLEALSDLMLHNFASNNVNYARWPLVHLRDRLPLQQNHEKVSMQ